MHTPVARSEWFPYAEGTTLGQSGPENGIIVRDEQHQDGARITLERDSPTAPFAITCGIAAYLVHTRYLSNGRSADAAFERMKHDLEAILRLIPADSEPIDASRVRAIHSALLSFVQRFS